MNELSADREFKKALAIGEDTLNSVKGSISVGDEIELRQRLCSLAYKALEIETAWHHVSTANKLCVENELDEVTRKNVHWQMQFVSGVSKKTRAEVAQMVELEINGFKDYQAGKYAEAEPQFRRLAELEQKTLGEHHPYLAYSQELIATCCAKQRKYDEAIIAMKQAFEINSVSSTYRPNAVGNNASELGRFYQKIKNFELAHDCFVNAYRWFQEDNDKLACADTATQLVETCVKLKKIDDAVKCFYVASNAYNSLDETIKETAIWKRFPYNASLRHLEQANEFLIKRFTSHHGENQIEQAIKDQLFRFIIVSRFDEPNHESQLDAVKQIVRLAIRIGNWEVISTFQEMLFPDGIDNSRWDRTARHLLCDFRLAKQLEQESKEFRSNCARALWLIAEAEVESNKRKAIQIYLDAIEILKDSIGDQHEVYSNVAIEIGDLFGELGEHDQSVEWFATAELVRSQIKGQYPATTEAKLSWIHALANSGKVEQAVTEMEKFRSSIGIIGAFYDKTLVGILRSEIQLKEEHGRTKSALYRAHVLLAYQKKKSKRNAASIIETEMICSRLHVKLQEQEEAINHAENAAQKAMDLSSTKTLCKIYVDTASLLVSTGNTKLTSEYIQKAESAVRQLEDGAFRDRQRSLLKQLDSRLASIK